MHTFGVDTVSGLLGINLAVELKVDTRGAARLLSGRLTRPPTACERWLQFLPIPAGLVITPAAAILADVGGLTAGVICVPRD